jgi:hypothetical protein
VEHRGQRILLIDFTGMTDPAVVLEAVAEVRALVAAQPPASLLTLTDVTGSTFEPATVDAVKQLARDDQPYVRAAAVVGVTGLARIVMSVVTLYTGRTFGTFDTVDEAKDWLVSQAARP